MSKPSYFIKHRLVLSIAGAVILTVVVVGGFVAARPVANAMRLAEINSIYASLKLGNDYIPTSDNVFGDKRVYDWDKGRTFSSSKKYLYLADVDTTAADLRKKIEAAGYTFIGEPYPGSLQIQYHFKSKSGHYIRMSVSSAHRDAMSSVQDDALFAKYEETHSPKEAPSNVLIKVNLDDNNE